MEKVVVLSDSHGEVANMGKAIKAENPDLVIHLGDCMRDVELLKKYMPGIRIENVPGNCDMSRDPAERILIENGFQIFICHGHTRHVKAGYLNLTLAAEERQVDVALFGHTHIAYYAHHNGIVYMNPGSIGAPPMDVPPSYGVLLLDESTQKVKYDVKYLTDEA